MKTQNLTISERERFAYITGDTVAAAMLADMDDRQHEIARYRCALDAIYEAGRFGTMDSRQCAAAAYEVL